MIPSGVNEPFNSAVQSTLFNVADDKPVEDKADSFLGGLSRAFTGNDTRHYVDRRSVRDRCSTGYAVGLFVNATGQVFQVEVTKL